MSYLGIKKTKAYEIMDKVKRFYNGSVPDFKGYVKRDSVLNYLGTSIERELYVLEQLERKEG